MAKQNWFMRIVTREQIRKVAKSMKIPMRKIDVDGVAYHIKESIEDDLRQTLDGYIRYAIKNNS
jgi:hypothetical protein